MLHVAVPVLQPAGIADPKCTLRESARPPQDAKTVVDHTDQKAGIARLDLRGLVH
ncbi:hypothetical protein K3495_g8268 [Podosphaera aphanis]|nr:hypothetical protein K3495_g8268 [Podosphaera aphanis]